MIRRMPAFAAAVVALSLLAPALATAQPLHEREAQRLEQEGLVMAAEGHYERAGELFLQAYAHSRDPQRVLQAARSLQRGGQLAWALSLFTQYLALDPRTDNRREVERSMGQLADRLARTHGEVRVTSKPPGAMVTLEPEGRLVGITPARIWLKAGEATLRVSLPEHDPEEHTIRVATDQIASIEVVSVKPAVRETGALRLAGTLGSAEVRIDGQRVITASGTRAWRLVTGRHRVTVAHPAGPVWEIDVDVDADRTTTLAVPRPPK